MTQIDKSPKKLDAEPRQSGQAAVEFIIIFPVLFLILWSMIQFSQMYQAKTALHYATFNAARHASVRSGTFDAAREGLIKGMVPYYTTSAEANAVWSAEQEVRRHWDDEELFCINRINPTNAAFLDFGDPIPNDNLLYRAADIGASGTNIQDANLLKIEAVYCYPFLSIWNSLEVMQDIFADDIYQSNQQFCQGKRTSDNRPTVAITASSIVRMQTPIEDDWVEDCN